MNSVKILHAVRSAITAIAQLLVHSAVCQASLFHRLKLRAAGHHEAADERRPSTITDADQQ